MGNHQGSSGGGNEGITYNATSGTNRFGLFFPGSDKVVLGNRATNGTVELRANTSTGGSGGEVTVVTVEDNNVAITNAGLGVGTTGVTTTGLIRATNDVIAFYSSDERLKTNIFKQFHISDLPWSAIKTMIFPKILDI